MEKLKPGQRIRLDGVETEVETCWAQGKHWTIVLINGTQFSGSLIDNLLASDRLVLLEDRDPRPEELDDDSDTLYDFK